MKSRTSSCISARFNWPRRMSPAAVLPISFPNGPAASVRARLSIPIAGAGSGMQLTSGQGGEFKSTSLATGGLGAAVMITGGSGATCVRSPTFCTSETIGGHGGSITLQPGAGGSGTMAGTAGNASPAAELHVIGNFMATGTKMGCR